MPLPCSLPVPPPQSPSSGAAELESVGKLQTVPVIFPPDARFKSGGTARVRDPLRSSQRLKAYPLDATSRCKIFRKTNRAGGFEGGMTNGEDLIIRAAMKPIPTLMKPLQTVDIATRQPATASKERSDTCAIWAAQVVGEAMAAVVTADAIVEKFGGDALIDTLANLKHYRERLTEEFGL